MERLTAGQEGTPETKNPGQECRGLSCPGLQLHWERSLPSSSTRAALPDTFAPLRAAISLKDHLKTRGCCEARILRRRLASQAWPPGGFRG